MATARRKSVISGAAAGKRKTRGFVQAARRGAPSPGLAVRRRGGKIGGLTIRLKRAYDLPAQDDGPRVLVDRVWPRGRSKGQIKIEAWLGELGPSTALRKWFGHDPAKWEEFRARYRRELAAKDPLLDKLAAHARGGKLTLVFGARDPAHNQAVVIKELLEEKRAG